MKLDKFLLCGCAALGILSGEPAFAQSADHAASAEAVVSDAPAEIIVTAERRSQSLQKLATTASVLSREDLDKRQVQSVDGLARTTPAFTVNDTGSARSINVRGVGKSLAAPGVQSGVGYYVDGVPIPNDLFLSTPFFDLSRIEVLRGPQGTLVGMNSTGGALLIVTQNPTSEITGQVEQSVGQYDYLRTRAALNVPLAGEIGVRVAGEYEGRDSFSKNVGPASGSPGNLNRLAVRAVIGGHLTEGLEVYLRGEYMQNKTDGTVGKPVPGDPAPSYAATLAASPSDPFTVSRDIATTYDLAYFRIAGEVRLDIGDFAQLRSVTGFQRGRVLDQFSDVDGTSRMVQSTRTQVNEPVLSQELNLVSNPGGSLDWVMGFFLLNQDTNGTVAARATPSGAPITDQFGRLRLRNRGVFGQATYHVTDKFNLTGGLRYNYEKHFWGDGAGVLLGGGPAFIGLVGSSTDKAVTGRFTADYQLTPDHFIYATVSRGFKGGGLNTDGTGFDAETIWNYEAGLKSRLFDRHVTLQTGGFAYRNKQIQLQVYSPVTTLNAVRNAGSGWAYGVEFQVQAQFGGLGLNAGVGYTHTEFDDISLFDQRYPSPTPVQIGGRAYLFAPEFTSNVGAEYAINVGGGFSLTPRIQWSHTSSQWASVYQVRPTDYIEARDVVDTTLRLTPEGKGFSAELFATNLFDMTYVSSKSVATAAAGRLQYYGAPRQIGARLGYSF